MLTQSQIDSIINISYQKFILNEYDDFSKDYELYPSDEMNFQLNFDQYVRKLPDSEIADWINLNVKDYDEQDEDIKNIRDTISFTTDALLKREHKDLMWNLTNRSKHG